MINCAEDRILLRNYTYLLSEIMATYCIFTRSQISCFDKLYPSPFSGRVDSHVDVPFSRLISLNEFYWLVNLLSNFEAFLYYVAIFLF